MSVKKEYNVYVVIKYNDDSENNNYKHIHDSSYGISKSEGQDKVRTDNLILNLRHDYASEVFNEMEDILKEASDNLSTQRKRFFKQVDY